MRKLFVLVIVGIIALSFTGYRNDAVLSEMTISQGLAIDKDKDEISLTIQYLDLENGTGTTDALGSKMSSIVQAKDRSISRAVTKASASLSSPLYFGQNRVIVFGNDYCKNDLGIGVDYILRGVDSRVDMLLAMSDTTGDEIIKSTQGKARVPAQDVYKTLKSGEHTGISRAVSVNDLLNLYTTENCDIYLPILTMERKKATCNGIAIFSDGSLAGKIDEINTIGFLTVQNKLEGGTLLVKDDRLGLVSLEIAYCKAKNFVKIDSSGVKYFTDIKLKLNLNDVEKGTTTKVSEEDINRLEKLASKRISAMCRSAVKQCFDAKSDPFMFSKMMIKKYPSNYKDLSKNWRGNLAKFEYSAKASSKLQTINNSSTRG